jgi:hypothetical protein
MKVTAIALAIGLISKSSERRSRPIPPSMARAKAAVHVEESSACNDDDSQPLWTCGTVLWRAAPACDSAADNENWQSPFRGATRSYGYLVTALIRRDCVSTSLPSITAARCALNRCTDLMCVSRPFNCGLLSSHFLTSLLSTRHAVALAPSELVGLRRRGERRLAMRSPDGNLTRRHRRFPTPSR